MIKSILLFLSTVDEISYIFHGTWKCVSNNSGINLQHSLLFLAHKCFIFEYLCVLFIGFQVTKGLCKLNFIGDEKRLELHTLPNICKTIDTVTTTEFQPIHQF